MFLQIMLFPCVFTSLPSLFVSACLSSLRISCILLVHALVLNDHCRRVWLELFILYSQLFRGELFSSVLKDVFMGKVLRTVLVDDSANILVVKNSVGVGFYRCCRQNSLARLYSFVMYYSLFFSLC